VPKVKSSHLKHVEYKATDRSMIIQFKNGDKYLYKDVPIRTYQDLLNADSKGEHFNSEIRDTYEGKKL
jgi:KTSC domain